MNESQVQYVIYDDLWPKHLGKDIDVYLSSSIEDLKYILDEGVDMFDGYSRDNLKSWATLLYTINDSLAYRNLSGYNANRHKMCPIWIPHDHSNWMSWFTSVKFGQSSIWRVLQTKHDMNNKILLKLLKESEKWSNRKSNDSFW